mgnify:CR=1 FL=1
MENLDLLELELFVLNTLVSSNSIVFFFVYGALNSPLFKRSETTELFCFYVRYIISELSSDSSALGTESSLRGELSNFRLRSTKELEL